MGRVQDTTKAYRQRIIAREAQTSDDLTRMYQATWERASGQLSALLDKMQAALDRGDTINPAWLHQEGRLTNLLHFIDAQVNEFGDHSRVIISQLQHDAVNLGNQLAEAQLAGLLPDGVNWTFGRPSPAALHDLYSAMQPGSPLHDLFDEFGGQAADIAKQTLFSGVAMGDGPRQIARDLASNMQMPLNRALTISRTEAFRAFRSAASENYRANSDVLDGWIWTCDLSDRTCIACIEMSGTVHGLDEDLDEHVNGRCTQTPLTKPWADILGPLGIDTSDIPETNADIPSGDDWFNEQDAATQRDILGNAKYNAWQAGDLDLSDLVGHSDDSDWGRAVYEKSLKDLNLDASDYT